MRAYFFTNTWLSGLQKSLQSAHVVSEMALAAHNSDDLTKNTQFWDWAKNHRTIIILDGGSHHDLFDIIEFFESRDNFYPWAHFREDEESLNGAYTSVGIVLPEEIYELAKGLREGEYEQHEAERKFDSFHLRLIDLLNSCPLAR